MNEEGVCKKKTATRTGSGKYPQYQLYALDSSEMLTINKDTNGNYVFIC